LHLYGSIENPNIRLKSFEHKNAPDSCFTNYQGQYFVDIIIY